MLISMAGMNSCKDKCSEPEAQADINDLLGTWVSVDSMVRRNWFEGGWIMSKDTLFFLSSTGDNFENNAYNRLTISETGNISSSIYKFEFFNKDSLYLNYLGPYYILKTDTFRLKVYFSKNKDTITVENLTKVYRSRPFKVFARL